MTKGKMVSAQGSEWGGKQTGSIKRMGSNYSEFKTESNGSMNYEEMQQRITASDEKKIRRSMKHTMDSGH